MKVGRAVEDIQSEQDAVQSDLVLLKFSKDYGYDYFRRDYLEMIDLHERFFQDFRPKGITCWEVARGDILQGIFERGYRVDMLSDPTNGLENDAVWRAAAGLNIPVMIHGPPSYLS